MTCQCATVLFGILAGIGVFIMIFVGTTVVREYDLAKSFRPTECRMQGVDELGTRACSYCYSTSTNTRRNGRRTSSSRRQCRQSSLPCVRVGVSFFDDYHHNRSATYFPDAVEMSKSHECSFWSCEASYHRSDVLVRNRLQAFVDSHHQHAFPCYYSTHHAGRVIGKKIYSYNDAFHGMLWPGLITAGAVIGIFVTIFGLHEKCRKKPPPQVLQDNEEPNTEDTSASGLTMATGGVGSTPLVQGIGGHLEKTPLTGSQVINPPPPFAPLGYPTNNPDSSYLLPGSNVTGYQQPVQPPYPGNMYGGVSPPYPGNAGYPGQYPAPIGLPQPEPAPNAPPPSYNSLTN